MKESLDEFYKILKLDRKNSQFSRQHTLQDRYKELLAEVKELGEAIRKKDNENLREEMGDVLWDLLFLFVIAEEKGLFKPGDSIEDAMEKLKRRKPWIFTGEKVAREEEIRRWNETKKKERA